MARDPGSVWTPLPEAGAPDGYRKTQMIYHSTGGTGSARSIRDNWFGRADVVVESTFIVGKHPGDPTLQMMDSTDNADANGRANQRAISVEVVCTGSEPWTEWQVAECIRLGRWARATHPILPRVIPSEPESGFGWHVMFGAPGPWTSAAGKVCPGGPAIQQLKTRVFPAIFAGRAPEEESDMSWTENINRAGKDEMPAWAVVMQLRSGQDRLEAQLAGLRAAFSELARAVTSGSDVEPAAIERAAYQGSAKAINDLIDSADVEVSLTPRPPAA